MDGRTYTPPILRIFEAISNDMTACCLNLRRVARPSGIPPVDRHARNPACMNLFLAPPVPMGHSFVVAREALDP